MQNTYSFLRSALEKLSISSWGSRKRTSELADNVRIVFAGSGAREAAKADASFVHIVGHEKLWKDGGNLLMGSPGALRDVTVISSPTGMQSRHNCPSRPDVLTKRLLEFPRSGPLTIQCVVSNSADFLPSACAVYRAFPVVSYKADQTHSVEVHAGIVDPVSGEVVELPQAELEEANIIGGNIRLAQALTDLPPNELNPDTFTDIVKDIVAHSDSIKLTIVDDCEKAGLMGIHTVGKASVSKPRMLVLTHTRDSASGETVALVGKGITYDTGGLSLKSNMKGMKRDMGGAAAALGAFLSLARLPRLSPSTIHCVLCLAENSIGSRAYRNDDVVKLYSGKTVEINNTDAEGRLLLADGVAYAVKDLNADIIIDIATLTGAAAVASGRLHASIVSTDAELARQIEEAGRATGDLAHEVVFCPELHRTNIKSTIADMKNSAVAGQPDAPSSLAATFVYDHLVAAGFKRTKWAHIDMASVVDYLGERSTGYGVVLLTNLLRKK